MAWGSGKSGRLLLGVLLAVASLLALAGSALACTPRGGSGGDQPASVAPSPCQEQAFAEVEIATRPRLQIEVARTPEERARGLMFRPSMSPDAGMLFVFEQESQAGFWMRNTLIPLSIGWVDRDGTIVDIQDMQPLSDEVHTPTAPYWYAIEANQGWFEANGVGVGQRVQLCLGRGAAG